MSLPKFMLRLLLKWLIRQKEYHGNQSSMADAMDYIESSSYHDKMIRGYEQVELDIKRMINGSR